MKFLTKLIPNFQKLLVDRLVKEQVDIERFKFEQLDKSKTLKYERDILSLRREVDIEKDSLMKLQQQLIEEMETCREIEEVFAFKIHKLYQLSNSLQKVVKIGEAFIIATNEVNQCLSVLTSPNETQEKIDKLIDERSLSYLSRKAKSVKTSKEYLNG